MVSSEIVLCAPVRTAIGTYGGALKSVRAPELGAVVGGVRPHQRRAHARAAA